MLDFYLDASFLVPSIYGIIKLNFDGSCVYDRSLGGYGGIIRKEFGETRISFASPRPNGSIIEVELHALWRGILEIEELGVIGSILEGDSKVVVDQALGSI